MKLRTTTIAGLFLLTASALTTPAASAQGAQGRTPSRDQSLARIVATERAFAEFSLDSAAQKGFNRYLAHDAYVFRPRAMKASATAAISSSDNIWSRGMKVIASAMQ